MSQIRRVVVEDGCQVCMSAFEDTVYDARTIHGPWGYMCERCFNQIGAGLGVGKGQKYSTKTLEKIDG